MPIEHGVHSAEASHAVVAARVGLPVVRARIRPDGSGSTEFDATADLTEAVFARATVGLAGICAELFAGVCGAAH